MKIAVNFEIPDIIFKILFVILLLVFFTMTIILCTYFYIWIESASCEDLIEEISNGNSSTAVRHCIEVKLVELECWK